MTLAELKAAADTLTPAERADLLSHLRSDESGDDPEAVAAEWKSVARERLEQVRRGEVVGIPADEVLRAMRERHR